MGESRETPGRPLVVKFWGGGGEGWEPKTRGILCGKGWAGVEFQGLKRMQRREVCQGSSERGAKSGGGFMQDPQ